MNRRNILAAAALAPLAGCAAMSKDLSTVTTTAGKIAVTIEADAPTVVTAVSSALGIGLQVLAAVGSSTPVGAAISAVAAVAQPVIARVQAAIAASAAPVATDLAALQSATNSLLAAASGSYSAVANAAKTL
jgi:hypothetical protein